MSANDGAIDDGADWVKFELELAEYGGPVILGGPVRKAVVDRLPGPKGLRQVPPGQPGLGSEENGVDEPPVTKRRLASLRASRNQRLDSLPLRVGQRVTVHGQL